ncbi:MAG: hypothetical protein JWL75_527 [Parcubacteria group bacterium]|nr:hypothetical protein [Parcubacteria group bacterium]
MANVSFNEEPNYRYASTKKVQAKSSISGFLIRNNIAKDERSAQYVLLGIAVVAIIIAIFILTHSTNTAGTPHPLPVPAGTVLPSHAVR